MSVSDSYRRWMKRAALTFFSLLYLTMASCSLPRIIVLHDPLSPEEHVNLGIAYENNGETESAIEEYKRASKELPIAYLYLGNIYYGKGETSEAERYYRKAIKNEPDLADAYNNLAWMFYRSGTNFKEAETLARKALELDPSNKNYKDTVHVLEERIKREAQPTGP